MLTIFKFSASFGPKAETVLFSWGRGHGSVESYVSGKVPPPPLTIPWRRELQPDPTIGALLDWRSSLSRFAGRTDELGDFRDWCDNAPTPSVRFMSGVGGVGKTRLAAEFAEGLRVEGWGAGFLHLRDADKFQAFAGQAKGNLLIVDYPESNPDAIEELFGDLAKLEPQEVPLRVLLLSREGSDTWLDRIERSGAQTCFHPGTVSLSPLGDSAPYEVFTTASERAAEIQETTPLPLSEDAFDAWLKLAPENHRTLFIVALAVYGALHPDESVVTYTGPEVVTALARREIARFGKISRGMGLQADALARLSAMATIADGLESSAVKALARRSEELDLGIPNPSEIVGQLSSLGFLEDSMLPAVTPDILAAALVVEVFRQRKDIAPDWLWAAIEGEFSARVSTLGRLSYDAEVILGLRERTLDDIAQGEDDNTLSAWLRDAVAAKLERCEEIEPAIRDTRLEGGLLPAAVAVWRTLLEADSDHDRQADLWNNLSIHLGMLGNVSGALDASRESVGVIRRLAKSNPTHYEPNLATSLNSLSVDLSATGDPQGALAAIREAVEMYRRLASSSPARYEPELATSLNNLSNHLSATRDTQGALDTIREAVEIRRRLASSSPARYEADLAQSLNNLTAHFSATGDRQGALDASREAVEMYRLLAAASPARYEPDLARSISVLSDRLEGQGQTKAAIEAAEEALQLIRPYAERYSESEHGRLYGVIQQDLERLTGGTKPDTSGDSE